MSIRPSLFVLAAWLVVSGVSRAESPSPLSGRNNEAPFCYVADGTRTWPILTRELEDAEQLHLEARKGDGVLAEGKALNFAGIRVDFTGDGKLRIRAKDDAKAEFQLRLTITRDGTEASPQVLSVRRAPPIRPISYISDLVDDLIRIYWDAKAREFRPFSSDSFDQYFRRLQSQGVARLIVWQSPFPLITDPGNFPAEDWQRYESQVRAILACDELTESMKSTPSLKSHQWLKLLMAARLNSDFGRMFTQSALDHGIRLTASFRPFEPALTKYYEIPTFDRDGRFLWNFHTSASPAVSFHTDKIGFAHYREILRRTGRAKEAAVRAIEIRNVPNAASLARRINDGTLKLKFLASQYPPIDETSYVLVRTSEQKFELKKFDAIRQTATRALQQIDGVQVRANDSSLILDSLQLPQDTRFLIVRSSSSGSETAELPVVLDSVIRSESGSTLGRFNVYCALKGDSEEARGTRIVGVPPDGLYRTTFQTIENSVDIFRKSKAATWTLAEGDLVFDFGGRWSVEMADFNRPAARNFAVRQLKTILKSDVFDEIFINTRSHTQLAASTADGPDGIRPLSHYRLKGTNYFHYGIDRAFGPISMVEDPRFKQLATEQIAEWQSGAWQGSCQSSDSSFRWRYLRNAAVARGVRRLLQDVEREFPDTRVRVVIPHSEAVVRSTEAALATMQKPDGGVYGKDYFRHMWGSLNYIPAIGEGMAMVDLSGLDVEPVYLGIRYLPDQKPLDHFLNQFEVQLADNYGSRFRGHKGIVYEAQETMRGNDRESKTKRRREIICSLLNRKDIGEVILYESADWIYYLQQNDADRSGYQFLDECLSRASQ